MGAKMGVVFPSQDFISPSIRYRVLSTFGRRRTYEKKKKKRRRNCRRWTTRKEEQDGDLRKEGKKRELTAVSWPKIEANWPTSFFKAAPSWVIVKEEDYYASWGLMQSSRLTKSGRRRTDDDEWWLKERKKSDQEETTTRRSCQPE